jgi:hypothetical protein
MSVYVNRGRPDSAADFTCAANYPIVRRQEGKVDISVIFYSSRKPPDKVFSGYPIGGEREDVWYVEKTLTADNQTQISVISALNLCGAKPGSYLYSEFPPDVSSLSGASLGVAVVVAILGLGNTKFAFTGWMSSFGQERESVAMGHVDYVDMKIMGCLQRGLVLFFPLSTLKHGNKRTRNSTYFTHSIYTFRDYLIGVPYTDKHEGVGVANVAELIVLVGWMGRYTQTKV